MNLYDFEWRQYDPFTNRTTTMDPHADSYPSLSPYSWAANNPLSIIDPDGQDIVNTAIATTYTGADAQNKLKQLQSQQSSSSGNGDPEKPKFYSMNSSTQARREQMAQAEKDNQPGFLGGMGDGAVAGGKSTVDFFESLGTAQGWEDMANGLGFLGAMMNPAMVTPEKVMFEMAAVNYVQNIPNMSAYEMGYGTGYGTVKLAETILLSKGAGAVANLASRSRLLFDVGYKTLRPWGVVNTKRYVSGIQLGDFRFQFHKHALRGSGAVKLPHINIGTGGMYHIMLNRSGARQAGNWIFRGAKGS